MGGGTHGTVVVTCLYGVFVAALLVGEGFVGLAGSGEHGACGAVYLSFEIAVGALFGPFGRGDGILCGLGLVGHVEVERGQIDVEGGYFFESFFVGLLAEAVGSGYFECFVVVLQRFVYLSRRPHEYSERSVCAQLPRGVAAVAGHLESAVAFDDDRVGAADGVQTVGRGPQTCKFVGIGGCGNNGIEDCQEA